VIRSMVRLLTLSALILLLAVPTAGAGTRENILRECQGGTITGSYTPGQLRDARKNIPTDIDEYSDCRDVLARASLSGRSGSPTDGSGGGLPAGGGGSGEGGGQSIGSAPGGVAAVGGETLYPAGKQEEKALEKARKGAAVSIGDEKIVPGAAGFAADAARNGLPTTLLIVMILLALCAAAAAAPVLHRRVLARRAA